MVEIDANQNQEPKGPVATGRVPHRFGEQLRAIRLALNLTQIEVWLRSDDIAKREGREDFIISNTRLSAIEHGHALPGPAKLLALGEIYGLTLEQLVKLWATINRRQESQEAVQNTND